MPDSSQIVEDSQIIKNPQIIKDGKVVKDTWRLLDDIDPAAMPAGNVIIPLAILQSRPDLQSRTDMGVLLPNDVDLDSVAAGLINLPLIAIHFPAFTDGRGFSLARLLRERHGYRGEIRAVGHVIRDQLCYLKRCGFTAFRLSDDVDINAAVDSLNDFTEAYQASVDQPQPLFRRRA